MPDPPEHAAATRPTTRLATLKRRPEFLRVRSGARWSGPAFVLEAKRRSAVPQDAVDAPRFGFTVSKKVGGAVERNRIRRRLKAAVRGILPDHARRDFDYVIVARRPALDVTFAALMSDLVDALKRVHAPRSGRGGAASGQRQRK
jgi:ribonuclease P protein component